MDEPSKRQVAAAEIKSELAVLASQLPRVELAALTKDLLGYLQGMKERVESERVCVRCGCVTSPGEALCGECELFKRIGFA